jgi:hypothetical protein
MTLNIITQTIAAKEVKMVDISQPVQTRTIRADLYLKQLTAQQKTLQKQLDDITTKIQELTEAGVELPEEPIKPKII